MSKKILIKTIKENIDLKKKLIKLHSIIEISIQQIYNTIKNNKKIFICGNGGSASDAEHLSTEFLVRLRPQKNRISIPLISLTSNAATLTACANDYAFSEIFSRNLEGYGSSGDLLIVISTSGNSKNIIQVLKKAKKKQISTIGLLGLNGGVAKKYCDTSICVPSKITARIQECHIFLGHFILEKVEDHILSKK